MEISLQDATALLPILLLTFMSVVVMLCTAFFRHHFLIALLTFFGLLLTAASLLYQLNLPPIHVTPLLVIDHYSQFFTLLILTASAVITVLGYGYFKHRAGYHEELYILLLTATLGAVVLVSSFHFASLFLGLEILSVSLFAMAAYPATTLTRTDSLSGLPLEAGIKYLILSGISSAILAFGMAFIYASTGELEFVAVSHAIHDTEYGFFAIAGFAMLVAGIGFKLSLVPFHMWTPDIYQGSPAPVSAFIATISKGAALALLLRSYIALDGYRYEHVNLAIALIAMASMLIGNFLALQQRNLKRLLAYSSIAHSGYILVAFLAARSTAQGNFLAVEAVAYYIVTYTLTTLTAFGIVTVLSSTPGQTGETGDFDNIDDYRSLFWVRPVIASVLVAALLSLAGIPLTIGFIGKFYIFAAGVEGGLWAMLLVLIASSGIGLFYYLRLIMLLFKGDDETNTSINLQRSTPAIKEIDTPLTGHWIIVLLGLGILIFGIYPSPLIGIIREMAKVVSLSG